jgi:quercetin dioxygenase-like cupin family protein
MSPNRQPAGVQRRRLTAEQEPFLVARALDTTYSNGHVMHPHRHAAHQLLFASSGAMTVTGDRTTWMIPPGRAVLIPAGVPHAIRMWGEVAMRSLYFPIHAQAPVFSSSTCRVISVSALLRELILRVAAMAALDSRVAADAHLMAVLMDELETADIEPLLLPLPQDSRALGAAQWGVGQSGGWRHINGVGSPLRTEHQDARAGVPRRNRDAIRIVAAESKAARIGARAGEEQIGHRRRAGMRLLEHQRLHRRVQADVRVDARCDVGGRGGRGPPRRCVSGPLAPRDRMIRLLSWFDLDHRTVIFCGQQI